MDCVVGRPVLQLQGEDDPRPEIREQDRGAQGRGLRRPEWENCGEFLQNVFEKKTNERVKKYGVTFVSGGAGDWVMKGQITEFRYPKKAAAWGGWIGQAAGSGTVVKDWKIVDKARKDGRGRPPEGPRGRVRHARPPVNNVYTDEFVDFIKKHSSKDPVERGRPAGSVSLPSSGGAQDPTRFHPAHTPGSRARRALRCSRRKPEASRRRLRRRDRRARPRGVGLRRPRGTAPRRGSSPSSRS